MVLTYKQNIANKVDKMSICGAIMLTGTSFDFHTSWDRLAITRKVLSDMSIEYSRENKIQVRVNDDTMLISFQLAPK